MTTITHFNWYLNTNAFPIVPGDLTAATVEEATATRWVLSGGGQFTFAFEGTFTGYDAEGLPTGGVITSYTLTLFDGNGDPYGVTVSDFSLPVLDYIAYFAAQDSAGAMAAIWAGDQTLTGELANGNYLWAWGGDDVITGGDLNDNLSGGEGYDQVSAGGGDDVVHIANHREARVESIYGGDGRDTLEIDPDGVAEDAFVNLEVGFIRMDGVLSSKIFSFEDVDAGDGNDRLVGTNGNNALRGGGGDDTISAGAGDDVAIGGAGNDYVRGGDGNDNLSGSDGLDLLLGEAGKDSLDGGAGRDRLYGDIGDDTLQGRDGTDLLDGGDGADTLRGGDWSDTLLGGAGDDHLYEGGDNRFVGDRADDVMTGGTGADRFYWSTHGWGRDTITDFEDGVDMIYFDVSGVSSVSDLVITSVGGNAVITLFDGSTITVTGAAGQIDAADFVFGGA